MLSQILAFSGHFLLWVAEAPAQTPVVYPHGIVNAASLAEDAYAGPALVPGSLYSLFGERLAPAAAAAASFPLPRTLAGVSLLVNGEAVPLLYVSPRQINFQSPRSIGALQSFERVAIQVVTPAGESPPVVARVMQSSPGLFTLDGSGCGRGAVLNYFADGRISVNSPSESASPGGWVLVYGTAMGPVFFPPPDGEPATLDPVSRPMYPFGAVLGVGTKRLAISPEFEALAPGFAGLMQYNVRLPEEAPEGCAVPLTLRNATNSTQTVTVSIRRGGGPCRDTETVRLGVLKWKRVVTYGPEPGQYAEREFFSASFSEGRASWLDHERERGDYFPTYEAVPGPRCGVYAGANIEVGELRLEGAFGRIVVRPQRTERGEFVYEMELPFRALNSGPLTVVASGSGEVGPFQSTISVPPPIKILTELRPGMEISWLPDFRVHWTGGTPGTLVNVRFLKSGPVVGAWTAYGGDIPAEQGVTYQIGTIVYRGQTVSMFPSGPLKVVVRVKPGTPEVFAAPGLAKGVQHLWEYEHQVLGMNFR